MGELTGIQWTDHTFNPWIGCTKVSEGCRHCYAEKTDARFGGGHWGKGAPRKRTSVAYWRQPLAWNRASGADVAKGKRRHRVFCASLADVFDAEAPPEARGELWELIRRTPWLDWQLLTKRPENILRFAPPWWATEPLPNVWLGTSVEDQAAADRRIPELLKIPAAVRFLSMEPLLGPVDLGLEKNPPGQRMLRWYKPIKHSLHWAIIGGESGPGARPFHLSWARELVAQLRGAGVAAFVKQLGAAAADEVNGLAGAALKVHPDAEALVSRRLAHKKGGDWDEWPEDLRVRQFPEVTRV